MLQLLQYDLKLENSYTPLNLFLLFQPIVRGLTGLAQVNGRNSLSWEEKFAFDLAYVRDVSFKNDAKIILKTIGKVLRRSDVLTGAALHKVAGPLDRERVKKDKSHEG